MNSSNINYPVVQTNNNDFYLNHSYNKSYNEAGWVFMDYRNNNIMNKNTIIYAHSRVDGSMFHTLRNTLDEKWFNNRDAATLIESNNEASDNDKEVSSEQEA